MSAPLKQRLALALLIALPAGCKSTVAKATETITEAVEPWVEHGDRIEALEQRVKELESRLADPKK